MIKEEMKNREEKKNKKVTGEELHEDSAHLNQYTLTFSMVSKAEKSRENGTQKRLPCLSGEQGKHTTSGDLSGRSMTHSDQ